VALLRATLAEINAINGQNARYAWLETGRFLPDTLVDDPDSDRLLAGYKQLADVVILVSLPIAGCSLAVAVAAGLADRRPPFSVLRLTGVPLAMLRRVVALETVVPLVLTAAVSIAIGFLAAALFLRGPVRPDPRRARSPVLPDR
jgi:predicted lysophospholipase L1 biosynthesis ABC-type transport system permease subunit